MALVASSSSSRVPRDPRNPGKSLEDAIQGFESALTAHERTRLRDIKAIPDADAVMTFTAQLDHRARKGRSIASRLHSVLQSVRDFSAIVDTFVSSHPDIAALVWGSVKLTMLLATNYTSYFEAISDLFMGFRTHCPRFAEYQALYPTSSRLRESLCNFHASIIRCCKHVVEAIQRPWQKQLMNALWQSFNQEFKSDADDIQKCGSEVREEITFAKAQADHEYQELQKKEEKTTQWRLIRSENKLDKIKEMQLQHDQLESRRQRQELLESLSSYDCYRPFMEACKKRHCSTAQWMFSTSEFGRWNNETTSSPLLWCTGKIGSGKTITTASAIQHVFATKKSNECVTYFFLQYDDERSLKVETIIRSIIRQSLDPITISGEMETRLKHMNESMFSGLEDLVALLQSRIALSDLFYIFIDAMDEAQPAERRTLYGILSSLSTAALGLRLFIASRESLSLELRGRFPNMECISMASAGAYSDISLYIREALQERKQTGDLEVGDPSLFEEIQHTLTQHAGGMFLWVTYLIDELCIQCCDEDIRKSLDNLPKDLRETFNRALSRIVSRPTIMVPRKTFSWVAVAKRHLTLDELGDAISTDIGQSYSRPERRVNGIGRIVSWCENLLHVDEENGTVEFAHRTIYDFITGDCSRPDFAEFHVNLEEAEHYAGEICITYLHFNDFKTTLSTRPRPNHHIVPAAIPSTALGYKSGMAKLTRKFIDLTSNNQKVKMNHDTIGTLASYSRVSVDEFLDTLQQAHPFLKYAAEHWISHTKEFQDGRSTTFDLWLGIFLYGHDLVQNPWVKQESSLSLSQIFEWACQARHIALIRLIDSSEELSQTKRDQIMIKWAEIGDSEVLGILLERVKSRYVMTESLKVASRTGRLEVVERLLAANADVNADVNADATNVIVRTALQAASEGGHLQVVERLLAANANVNAAAADIYGRTALQAASEGGHLQVVERLLTANADVNAAAARSRGHTALQAASGGGYLEIVERLLTANADVNAAAARSRGHTALQAASEGGHLQVVERLLTANADVNAAAADIHGRTALQAASEGGHLQVVERLLTANADVNAAAAHSHSHTALQAASEGGRLKIAKLSKRADAK